ncbi:hypothetical protein M758_4G008400 [Ceratodon purpureus]|nr:hypothetical protein M758_4G008400 [Ceratodon purpureus]
MNESSFPSLNIIIVVVVHCSICTIDYRLLQRLTFCRQLPKLQLIRHPKSRICASGRMGSSSSPTTHSLQKCQGMQQFSFGDPHGSSRASQVSALLRQVAHFGATHVVTSILFLSHKTTSPLIICISTAISFALSHSQNSYHFPVFFFGTHLARLLTPLDNMSNFDATKDSAAQKAEETKGFGQQKAGEAHQATMDAAGATQDKAQDAAGTAQDKANQAGGMAGEKWEQTKQASSDATQAAQDKAMAAKDGAGNMLQQAQNAVGNAFNQAKDAVTPNQ